MSTIDEMNGIVIKIVDIVAANFVDVTGKWMYNADPSMAPIWLKHTNTPSAVHLNIKKKKQTQNDANFNSTAFGFPNEYVYAT